MTRVEILRLIQAEWTLLDFVVGRLTPADHRIQVLDAEATDPWTMEWQAGRKRAIDEHQQAHQNLVAMLARVPEPCLTAGDRPVLWLTPALGHSGYHRTSHIERLLNH